MSQIIELSDDLVEDARTVADACERSVSDQIESWVRLGRVVDRLLGESRAVALQRSGAVTPLSELFASVDTPQGRQRLAEYLETTPFPHYEALPDGNGLLVRIDTDGTRTIGRFVGREFQAVK